MQLRLTIENYLKVERVELPLEPGVIGLVGDNAQGKTTILTALQELLSGKNDVSKIRQGADRAVIRIDSIEDGQVVSTVQRIQTEASSRLEAKGLKIGHTASTYLSSILSDMAVNPIDLLDDPVEYLKKHLQVQIDRADYPAEALPLVEQVEPMQLNGFTANELVVKKLEEERLLVRKQMEQSEAVVKDLRVGMDQAPAAPQETREALEEQFRQVQQKKTELAVMAEKKAGLLRRTGEAQHKLVTHESLIKGFDAEIADLKAKLLSAQARRDESAKQLEEARQQVTTFQAEADAFQVPTSDQLNQEEQEIRRRGEALKAYEQHAERKQKLEQREAEHLALAGRFDRLDQVVKQVKYDVPKQMFMRAEIGVDGISIRDGELYVGDFNANRLSTAERAVLTTKIALAIAKRKGHVAVCLDGIEVLDAEHRKELLEAATASGLCLLYTRMGSPELPFERVVQDGKVLQ